MTGRLIGVVGPSGVGKDTVMQGIARVSAQFGLVRRTITRAPGLGGEEYDAVSDEVFAQYSAAGVFCVHWQAHGLSYGIADTVRARVRDGEELLVNLSRSVLTGIAAAVPSCTVLRITAEPQTLARRLAGRGRETAEEIAERLNRPAPPLPPGLTVLTVSNDGAPEECVAQALSLLRRENTS